MTIDSTGILIFLVGILIGSAGTFFLLAFLGSQSEDE